jgi:cell division protease FtsH
MSDNDNNNGQRQGNGGPPGPQMPDMGGNFLKRWGPLLLIVGVFAIPWLVTLFAGVGRANTVSYSQFKEELEAGNVQAVQIQGERIRGQFSSAVSVENAQGSTGQSVTSFQTYFPSRVTDDFLSTLDSQGVSVFTQPESEGNFFTVLLNILPFLLMIWIFVRLSRRMRQQGGGMFQVGKSKAKKFGKEREIETTFEDVAGIESAKSALMEVTEYLKDPRKFEKLGATTPKGLLLVGPPGSGKTLLARAVAGEAGVPFFSITGSDFMEMFVGVGASRVRDLFKDAKKNAPSIIFIDELDSIGRRRGAGLGGGHDEREQTLNQLLSELDGFEKHEQTIVMGATNRPDILDPALERPGRFDRRITVNLPPMKDRIAILKIHARGKPISDDVSFEEVARNTPGFSGADLENLLNEAALIAAQSGGDEVTQEHLDQARDKIMLGLERTSVVLEGREKEIVAYHETGHAVVGAVLEYTEPIHKVTIIPREHSMGVTQQLPDKDKYIYERRYLEDRLAVMMGGRAAEQLVAETMTSGAENDLKQAKRLARKMVLDWGMSDAFKNVALGQENGQVFLGEELSRRRDFSDETMRVLDKEIKSILNAAYDRAVETLKSHRDEFEQVAEELKENEEISGDRVYDILGIEKDRNGSRDSEQEKEEAEAGS